MKINSKLIGTISKDKVDKNIKQGGK